MLIQNVFPCTRRGSCWRLCPPPPQSCQTSCPFPFAPLPLWDTATISLLATSSRLRVCARVSACAFAVCVCMRFSLARSLARSRALSLSLALSRSLSLSLSFALSRARCLSRSLARSLARALSLRVISVHLSAFMCLWMRVCSSFR